jgi:poly(ADP-ribose) glycohydrolase ARH3
MIVACAQALVTTSTIEPHALFRAIKHNYEPARGFGRGMKIALAAFESGTPWERCAFAAWPEGSRGNGGAVRIPPVAVAQWETHAAFDVAVDLTTRITHAHPEAIAFAHLQAVAIATVLGDPDLVDQAPVFHARLLERLAPAPTIVVQKLETIRQLLNSHAGHVEAARILGTSTTAAESVSVGLWSFLARHSSFSDAVASAALLGGDVDSICSLVGALAGALHGLPAIERSWVTNLANERPTPDEILELADAIHALEPASPTTGWLTSC